MVIKNVWAVCQGHDGSGLGENMAVVAEKDPGKCMGRLNWNGRIVIQTYPRASSGKWGFQSSVGF